MSAAYDWARWNFSPLELVGEIIVSGSQVRIAAPGRPGWIRQAGAGWQRLPMTRLTHLLRPEGSRTTQARLLLTRRETPDVFRVLAERQADGPAHVASWLGWPEPDTRGSITHRIRTRGNDYWALDLAARAVGLGHADTGTAPALPLHGGISIVNAAHDAHDLIPGFLAAAQQAAASLLPGTAWEVLVVDNASAPALTRDAGLPPHVRFLRSNTLLDHGSALRLGTAHARYELLALCDPATVLCPGYLTEHVARHLLSVNLVSVSLSDSMTRGTALTRRWSDAHSAACDAPSGKGPVSSRAPALTRSLAQARGLRDFGHGPRTNSIDLPLMAAGSNLVMATARARHTGFPRGFSSAEPEAVCFAAKAIAQGCFILPVLSAEVRRVPSAFEPHGSSHPVEARLRRRRRESDWRRYSRYLSDPADEPWRDHSVEGPA